MNKPGKFVLDDWLIHITKAYGLTTITYQHMTCMSEVCTHALTPAQKKKLNFIIECSI